MNKSPVVTVEELKRLGACPGETAVFNRLFPEGLSLTLSGMKKALMAFPEELKGKTRTTGPYGVNGNRNGALYIEGFFRYMLKILSIRDWSKAARLPYGSKEREVYWLTYFKQNKEKILDAFYHPENYHFSD